jgi:hypothetical protein
MLMTSAKTVILLNGIPGLWIPIKRGLRQGDPLSSLLFIIIVDVLQKVIKKFSEERKLKHPIVEDITCLVIQYADDTLILIQGCPDQARVLKEILDTFSSTTGLKINYNKSTFVPINLEQDEQHNISNILGCPIASFPQTYLGLPLSDSKLPRWALQPILQTLDTSIDTFSVRGASSGGRLALTKSVLSAMPSHTLAYIKAPKWFHNEINKRRRAYFWTGQKSATGAQCKVAWDTVCRPTEEGGLNIKNLEIQNTCLLLKFIHKLHTSNRSSWAKWIKTYVYKGHKRLGDKLSVCSSSWRSLMPLIQLYRDLTWVTIGDGTSTCFWLDSWIGKKPLSIQYPALFSHVQNPNITVAESCTELGWQIRLRHLTSLRAENELLNRLEQISLREEPDERYMRFGPDKKFLVKGCYHALNFGGTTIPGHKEVWDSWAPKKCKIFAWLALHNRLNTRARLARRGIIEDTNCPFDCQTEEILTHLLFH